MVIEVNGKKIDADNIQDARREFNRLAREEKKAEAKRHADGETATLKAYAKAFNILERKVRGETFPSAWRLYKPYDKWTVCHPVDGERYETVFTVESEETCRLKVKHYGQTLIGAVCGGAGYTLCVFFQDTCDGETLTKCFALGVHGQSYRLVEVPGIVMGDFPRPNDAGE